jgi:hypothetical protein
MDQPGADNQSGGNPWWRGWREQKKMLVTGITLICLVSLLGAGVWVDRRHVSTASATVITNGAARWADDSLTTTPHFSISAPDAQQPLAVAQQFQAYYQRVNGALNLGAPVTAAFPVRQGWIQFFAAGALLLPVPSAKNNSPGGDDLAALIHDGVVDQQSGTIRLPLVQSLLTAGSLALVGGVGSPLTYVDLRQATQPDHMLPKPGSKAQGVFVQGGTRSGTPIGHLIPTPLWQYINRSDVSPDGWLEDIGLPLTEALPITIVSEGGAHQVLVQVFWHQALLLDRSALDSSGQPQVQPLASGLDYLRTLGPPQVTLGAYHTIWAESDTALLKAPETGAALAHVGQHFPLTLLGNATWSNGTLWYHVGWSAPKSGGTGWAPAATTSFVSPGTVPGWASFDVLSPDLESYLDSIGDNVDAVVYDLTRQRYYAYNASAQFIMGSSIKVPTMLALLNLTESQDREPDDNEMYLLTTMIENSDNDSAAALYYDELGPSAITSYLQSLGITDMVPDCCAFGYSLTTPLAMVNLLTMLDTGTILTAQDRGLALSLMGQIESDQQVGVGDSAPPGATWAMKDGWLPGPDDLWAMNSSGIITLDSETYIISVYTQEQNSLEDGQAIVQQVCNEVASLLL